MEIYRISGDAVRQALTCIRYAKPLRGLPLLELDAVSARLRAEGVTDTADSREWALTCILQELVRANLVRCRSDRDSESTAAVAILNERDLLTTDSSRGDADLRAWSAMSFRYLSTLRLPTDELARELGVSRRTLGRRLADGHRALAAELQAAEAAATSQAAHERPKTPDRFSRDSQAAARMASAGHGEPLALRAEPRPEPMADIVRLPPARLAEIRGGSEAGIRDYWRSRVDLWSQDRYALDRLFVPLTLLLEQGGSADGRRWNPGDSRYRSLGEALSDEDGPALILVGPPGAGKSTLLRRLDLDTARAGLSGASPTVAFYVPLSTYVGDGRSEPAPPAQWLSHRWSRAGSSLSPLDRLLADGRMLLLLDGLNEMPHRDSGHYRDLIAGWRRFLQELSGGRSANRAVFSCRSLDYSAPLSTPGLPVPRLEVEPLSDGQIRRLLSLQGPGVNDDVWSRLVGSPELDLLRQPYYLRLSIDQLAREGRLETGRAALITAMIRRAMRREIELDNRLFRPGELLAERDYERIVAARQWRSASELPDRGPLLAGLVSLAYGMQSARAEGGAAQVSIRYEDAIRLLGDDGGANILRAGEAMGVLDEDRDRDEVMFRHELIQEYFAARRLADDPESAAALVAPACRARDVAPAFADAVEGLPRTEAAPPLPQTGWEETVTLAANMAEHPSSMLLRVADANLALAGRIAAQGEVSSRVPPDLIERLRWSLARRSRDPEADVRDRIACGSALGALGDARYELRHGPGGAYLWPPMIDVPAGVYPIGEDEAISWEAPRTGVTGTAIDHIPRHGVNIAGFRIGQFPVTNAEWSLFVAGGGYDDDRWWDTEDAGRWQRAELVTEGPRNRYRMWRRRFAEDPALLDRMAAEGVFPNQAVIKRWRRWMELDDTAFERAQEVHWRPMRAHEPPYWRDLRYNEPTQPVLGVCWYEARAYCNWLSRQSRSPVRLPIEAEWEAAARGFAARAYPWGDATDRLVANTYETHLRRPTPVGVFPEGDTPEGIADLVGNVWEWTSSLWGSLSGREWQGETLAPEFGYPYDPSDGRENADAPASVARISRGGSWNDRLPDLRAAVRNHVLPGDSYDNYGLRIVSPIA